MKKSLICVFAAVAAVAMVAVSCQKDPNGKKEKEEEKQLHTSLQGSNYAICCMDDDTYASIEEKIMLDLRNNGDNANWYDWAGNIIPIDKTGTNFYGVDKQNWYYLKLDNISAGWSGGGLNVALTTPGLTEYFAEVAKEPQNYYLHFAYRNNESNTGLAIYPAWVGQEAFKFAVGDAKITVYDSSLGRLDEKSLIQPISGQYKVGEWNEYEVCVKDFGYDYTVTEGAAPNVFCANPGTELGKAYELDAIFYYKKN